MGSCHYLEGSIYLVATSFKGSKRVNHRVQVLSESLCGLLMLQSPNASHKNICKVWSFFVFVRRVE